METKQCVWSEEEKDWLRSWSPKLHRNVNRLTEQVSRFKESLPDFALRAEEAAQPFLESGRSLLRLSWQNKFNPMSKEEAEAELKTLNEKADAWFDFNNRPDVSTAVAEVNRKLRKSKREQQKAARDLEGEFVAYIGSEDFDRTLHNCVANVMKQMNEYTALGRDLKQFGEVGEYGKEECMPLLQRLLLIHFIRFTYECDQQVRESVSKFLRENSSATAEDLLTCAVRSMLVETVKPYLKGRRLIIQGVNDPNRLMSTYIGQAYEGLVLSIEEWQKQGLTPASIGKRFFTVQGVDFSLDAKPT